MTVLMLEEVRAQGLPHFKCCNGDYAYKTEDGYFHLIREGKDLLEGLKAMQCHSYPNGDYDYRAKNGYMHLICDGKDLLEGLRVAWCWSIPGGNYGYITNAGKIDYICRTPRVFMIPYFSIISTLQSYIASNTAILRRLFAS